MNVCAFCGYGGGVCDCFIYVGGYASPCAYNLWDKTKGGYYTR